MSVSEHLDFRLLKYIVAVAEEGTFTAAAMRLNLSQSALSTQIKTLEDNLGVKIFDRERGTTLTTEGKVLLRYGREGLRTREPYLLDDTARFVGSFAFRSAIPGQRCFESLCRRIKSGCNLWGCIR